MTRKQCLLLSVSSQYHSSVFIPVAALKQFASMKQDRTALEHPSKCRRELFLLFFPLSTCTLCWHICLKRSQKIKTGYILTLQSWQVVCNNLYFDSIIPVFHLIIISKYCPSSHLLPLFAAKTHSGPQFMRTKVLVQTVPSSIWGHSYQMLELISAFTAFGLFLLATALGLIKSVKTKQVCMLKFLFSPTGKAFEGILSFHSVSKPCRFSDIQPILASSCNEKGIKKPKLSTYICLIKLARQGPNGKSRSSLCSVHSMQFLCWIDNLLTTCMPIALRRGKDRLRDERRQPDSYNSDFHRAFRLRCSWNSFIKSCELSHWRNISSDTIVGERKDLKLWKYDHKCFAE